MKEFLLLILCCATVAGSLFGQGPCMDVKLITPVVAKPKQGTVLSISCSVLQVQWKGATNQTYIASADWFNTATNKWDTAYATSFSCDGSLTCKASIPVQGGTEVSWHVQATQLIGGRMYYSYYLIGERALPVPACTPVVTKAEVKATLITEPVAVTEKLVVFPNPATHELTIQWNGEYKGTAVIVINDAAGKEVRVQRVSKEGAVYTSRMAVGTLVAGLYYVQVKPQNGLVLTGKFLKQ